MRHVVVVIAMAFALISCADGTGAGEQPTTAPPSTTTAPTTPPSEEDSVNHDDPEATAIADLASFLGVAEDEIDVVSHERVTWRDGSLGCPEPGMMYTQALVEGYRIVLRADGQDHAYHGATDRAPFRCDDPDPDGTATPQT